MRNHQWNQVACEVLFAVLLFLIRRVESVHYTGFFSSYEEAMQQILVDQVRQAQSKIRQVVEKAMIHCRQDALWELVEMKVWQPLEYHVLVLRKLRNCPTGTSRNTCTSHWRRASSVLSGPMLGRV